MTYKILGLVDKKSIPTRVWSEPKVDFVEIWETARGNPTKYVQVRAKSQEIVRRIAVGAYGQTQKFSAKIRGMNVFVRWHGEKG